MRYDHEIDEAMSLLDAVHRNRQITDSIAHHMEELAGALYRVGQTSVADEIICWIDPLMQSAKQVTSSYSIELNRQIGEQTAMSTNMVMLAIEAAGARASRSASK